MTKRLEEVLNLPPMPEEPKEEHHITTVEEAEERATEILTSLTASEKVDHALTAVVGLNGHDAEMDEISNNALEAYAEIKELAFNVSDVHAAKLLETAGKMLEVAMNARDRKIDRKLRTIDLQLKKMKLDRDKGDSEDSGGGDSGVEFDRNELLRRLRRD
jgi:hypothetical protein